MATIWITYAWSDNTGQDIDFVAQELVRAGLTVKLDRWTLSAGGRLWDQIANSIQNPTETDAWLLYATETSLRSEACREEFAYALDRALNSRGDEFPVIALFPAPVTRDLIPAGIRSRLYVTLADSDWRDRIVAAAERRPRRVATSQIPDYALAVHAGNATGRHVAEVRPRTGVWAPFIAAVPTAEINDPEEFSIMRGMPGHVPAAGISQVTFGITVDGQWAYQQSQDQATPTQSYFIFLPLMPSQLLFGAAAGPHYVWKNLLPSTA